MGLHGVACRLARNLGSGFYVAIYVRTVATYLIQKGKCMHFDMYARI